MGRFARSPFAALVFGVLLYLDARPAAAPEGAGATLWWRSASVQAQMHLTAVQVKRLDALYEESLPARRRLHAELAPLQARLAQLMASGPFDDDSALLLVKQVCALEKQRNIARTMMLVRMFRVLDAEQRASLIRHAPNRAAPGTLSRILPAPSR